jgi:hypothetical protein
MRTVALLRFLAEALLRFLADSGLRAQRVLRPDPGSANSPRPRSRHGNAAEGCSRRS